VVLHGMSVLQQQEGWMKSLIGLHAMLHAKLLSMQKLP
jgi:hypothetical protein